MKYEEMSDLVIDRKVFVAIYGECIGDKDMHRVWQDNKFRPCSNPSDAWPIIFENKIGLMHNWNKEGFWSAIAPISGVSCDYNGRDPLRAAMICFLKMKDAESGKH